MFRYTPWWLVPGLAVLATVAYFQAILVVALFGEESATVLLGSILYVLAVCCLGFCTIGAIVDDNVQVLELGALGAAILILMPVLAIGYVAFICIAAAVSSIKFLLERLHLLPTSTTET